jgi:1-acyl-sn-glycerol-3-phosphate acyltransferase
LKLRQHALASASIVFIVVQLSFWCLLLTPITLLRLAIPRAGRSCHYISVSIYRSAVRANTWWLQNVIGVAWNCPSLPLDRDSSAVVICNHRSWCDVLLAQDILTNQGPIVKFLAKRELAFVPILGLIIFAFNFPLLKRRTKPGVSDATRRTADQARVTRAALQLLHEPAAILIFVEGTRYTDEKNRASGQDFLALLPPRVGGFAAVVAVLRESEARVIDVTLHFNPHVSFWQFIGGVHTKILIEAQSYAIAEIPRDITAWLQERWRLKDAALTKNQGAH